VTRNTRLLVRDIDTYYEQSHVLQGVSLQIESGTLVGLLGRNGAGKTTTLKSIMGIVPPRAGQVFFDGVDLVNVPPYRVARHGIAYVPEHRGIFASLSVMEHLTLAKPPRGTGSAWTLSTVFDMFPRLYERKDHAGTQLSGGEQQMLSIARALMLNPRLLILDEPAEGLAPVMVREIARSIENLKSNGMTILLVEQNYPFVAALADYLFVLGKGRVRWSGTSEELERNPDVKHTWIGL